MASQGARVMHSRAVELGWAQNVEILVANSAKDVPGTLIKKEDPSMEVRNPVRGIAHDDDVARITVLSVPDHPGIAYQLFSKLAESGINVDVIVQNVSQAGLTDVSFTVSMSELEKAKKVIDPVLKDIGAKDLATDENMAKVSIIGSGIRSHPGYASKMFGALSNEGINIVGITTSEIRITCLIEKDKVKPAVRALHKVFQLENP
jgi:aspartate kinase